MARNLLAARAVSAGPQPVAGGSCRRITLLRLRRLRLRPCPPPPARAASLPRRAPASASRSASVYSFATAAPAPGPCAGALRRSIAPPWSASALASQRCARACSTAPRRRTGVSCGRRATAASHAEAIETRLAICCTLLLANRKTLVMSVSSPAPRCSRYSARRSPAAGPLPEPTARCRRWILVVVPFRMERALCVRGARRTERAARWCV